MDLRFELTVPLTKIARWYCPGEQVYEHHDQCIPWCLWFGHAWSTSTFRQKQVALPFCRLMEKKNLCFVSYVELLRVLIKCEPFNPAGVQDTGLNNYHPIRLRQILSQGCLASLRWSRETRGGLFHTHWHFPRNLNFSNSKLFKKWFFPCQSLSSHTYPVSVYSWYVSTWGWIGGKEAERTSMIKGNSPCVRPWAEEYKPDPCHIWKVEWL